MFDDKKKLGRGLSSLIGESYSNFEEVYDKSKISELEVGKIVPGKYQPRQEFDPQKIEELSESIKQNGVIQLIVVREAGEKFEIIAGERRFRAAKAAGLDTIGVVIKDIDDKSALELAIIENVQRQDLNVIEEALGYKRLIDEFGYVQEQVAEIIGKSRSHIANMMRLLNLPDNVKSLLNESRLSAGHARLLLTVQNPEELASQIIDGNMSVRETEALVKTAPQARPTAKKREKRDPKPTFESSVGAPSRDKDLDIIAMEQNLSSNLGMDVEIDSAGDGGKVMISYKSLGDLDKLLGIIESNNF